MIRVVVVDDHDLFRTGLATLLASQPNIDVVGQASGGRMAVRLVAELRPDVVLMDLRMPDIDGHEVTQTILRDSPSTRIVVLTVVIDDAAVTEALEAGACGFLAKDTPVEFIVIAVRAAAQGAAWLSPLAAQVMLGRLREAHKATVLDPTRGHTLSPRELDVLRLVAQGMENSEIAEALQISQRTAKNHVSNILMKLGLPSRVQAAVFAVRHGLA